MAAKSNLSQLVGYGGVTAIANKLGILPGTVSSALRRGNPGHPAVREALRIAKESGAFEAARDLAALPNAD